MMLAASLQLQNSSLEFGRTFQTGDQGRNHFVQFFNWLDPFGAIRNISKLLTKKNHGFEFLQGTKSDVKASSKVNIRTLSMSFGNVRGNRNHGPLHLRSQTKSFRSRQSFGEAINSRAQQKALFPNQEFFEVRLSHFGLRRFDCLFANAATSFLRLAACSLKLEATL